MSLIEMRAEIHKYIDQIGKKELEDVFALIKKNADELTIAEGYTPSGEILTKEKIISRAKAASNRVKTGHFISQEDVEKISKTW